MSAAASQEQPAPHNLAQAEDTSASALRQLAAERLAAHRHRRAALLATQTPTQPTPIPTTAPRLARRSPAAPAATVRDAVLARYQRSQSYQEFLALESERALQKAQAEAEIAARNAAAVAEAQRKLLEEIDHWNQAPEPTPAPELQPLFVIEPAIPPSQNPIPAHRDLIAPDPATAAPEDPKLTLQPTPAPTAPLTVQLFSELPQPSAPPPPDTPLLESVTTFDPAEIEELDDEIAFRLAPQFQDLTLEPVTIQANIIEFPRQIVAPRKARPRLAEGPLRDDAEPQPQLRIFEVESGHVSAEPAIDTTAAPDWQSLQLPAEPMIETRPDRRPDPRLDPRLDTGLETILEPADPALAFAPPLDPARNLVPAASGLIHAAPINRRLMAITVDAVCVGAAFVVFSTLAAQLCGPTLRGMERPELIGTAALALAAIAALYQILFFWFNEATPGMVYARLCFCTFADANPTRAAVRRRLIATLIAVCPLGLGLLWMALDPDRLGWHDRISRMYPRAY